MPADTPKRLPRGTCSQCWKALEKCVCAAVRPLKARTQIVFLQHPREVSSPLGTARLASLNLPASTHRVGLSWPSLAAALRRNKAEVHPSDWAVLVVASRAKSVSIKGPFRLQSSEGKGRSVQTVKGLIVLDGNWKQAKALWWRNPWLTRLARLELNPSSPSLYGQLRREPRANLVSTIEATALALRALGESPKISEGLFAQMKSFIEPEPLPPSESLSESSPQA